jgi:hypothetical protein
LSTWYQYCRKRHALIQVSRQPPAKDSRCKTDAGIALRAAPDSGLCFSFFPAPDAKSVQHDAGCTATPSGWWHFSPIFGPFWLDNQRKPPTPVILSRLAGPLRDVVQYARPHRKPKGTIVLYKTRDCAEELRKAGRVLARHKLRVTGSYDISLPLSRVPRRFIVLGS